MPRRVAMRDANGEPSEPGSDARRQWLTRWKSWAVTQLAADAPQPVKVQLRVDVERALARYRPDADETEIRDVVSSVIEEAAARVAAKDAEQFREACKEVMIALASTYLQAALVKF